jgi:MFS transporter, ACS family, 4-hydroxyphenylacetate permease
MATISVADYASGQLDRNAAIKKIWWRLIPFLFVLYIFNYLDRINIGFAALSMNKDLALTATTFGLANSIFYIGYVACEIPSNLLMVRYGARVWIARILISWGLASAATMLVVGPNSLYLVRFLVGVLEAGFVPGVLLYLTYWIPNSHRARANGYLMMAQPVAMALGGGVSGLILDHLNGTLGLQGWRWLFLLEGLPAVILGVIAYAYLTDKPADAAWLEETEKNTVTSLLATDQARPTVRQRFRYGSR